MLGIFERIIGPVREAISSLTGFFSEAEAGEVDLVDEQPHLERDLTPADVVEEAREEEIRFWGEKEEEAIEEIEEVVYEIIEAEADFDEDVVQWEEKVTEAELDYAEEEAEKHEWELTDDDLTDDEEVFYVPDWMLQEEKEQRLTDDDLTDDALIDEIIDFPNWITGGEAKEIVDVTGVTDFGDLTPGEKDVLVPDWRGFEAADEPAGEIDDMAVFRKMAMEELGIETDLSDEELMTLLTIMGNADEYKAAFEEFGLEPEEIADEYDDTQYRGEFDDIEWFVNSSLFDFIMQRPNLFEIFIDSNGIVYVYEVKDT